MYIFEIIISCRCVNIINKFQRYYTMYTNISLYKVEKRYQTFIKYFAWDQG